MLEKVTTGTSFDHEKRSIAEGVLTAYLFWEIFSITGLLSRMLQSVKIDSGKAQNMIEVALEQLQLLCDNPRKIIDCVERDFDSEDIKWEEKRIIRRKRMDGEISHDESPESAETL